LVVLYGAAAGLASVAHATERVSAPVHIEAERGSACLALHDEMRCVLCHFSGLQVTLPQMRARAAPAPRVELLRPADRTLSPVRAAYLTAPPRAPPPSPS